MIVFLEQITSQHCYCYLIKFKYTANIFVQSIKSFSPCVRAVKVSHRERNGGMGRGDIVIALDLAKYVN